jgi:hypothetical protein
MVARCFPRYCFKPQKTDRARRAEDNKIRPYPAEDCFDLSIWHCNGLFSFPPTTPASRKYRKPQAEMLRLETPCSLTRGYNASDEHASSFTVQVGLAVTLYIYNREVFG